MTNSAETILAPSFRQEYSYTIPTDASELASFIVINPQLLPDIVNRTIMATQLANVYGDEAEHAIQEHFLDVNKAIKKFDWKLEPSQVIISKDTAIALLDTLVQTSREVDPLHQRLGNTARNTIHSLLNNQHGVHRDWKGAVRFIHTLTEAAFSDAQNLPRIRAWQSLFDHTSDIFANNSVAKQSLFLAFHDPHPKNEDALRMAIDLQYAHFAAASILGTKNILESLDQNPQLLKWLDTQTTALSTETRQNRTRFAARSQLLEYYLGHQQETRTKTGIRSLNLTFPDTVFLQETKLQAQVSGAIETLASFKSTKEYIAMRTSQIIPHGVIIPINADLSGFVVVDPETIHPDAPKQEKMLLVQSLLKEFDIKQQFDDLQPHLTSSRLMGTEFIYKKAYFYILKENLRTNSPLTDYFELVLPESLQAEGLSILEKIIKARSEIARSFTHSLTRSGVYFPLDQCDALPNVFEYAQLWLQEPGVFAFSIVPMPRTDIGFTSLPPITGIITLDGQATIRFNPTLDDLPIHVQWFLSKNILSLFRSQCCRSHEEIPFVEEPGFGNEEHAPLLNDIPGTLVHIGARKKSGDPGTFTLQAVRNHAWEVYRLELPEQISMEEALLAIRQIGGRSLLDINIDHRKSHEGCPKNLTWRKTHESQIVAEPILVLPPDNLFL